MLRREQEAAKVYIFAQIYQTASANHTRYHHRSPCALCCVRCCVRTDRYRIWPEFNTYPRNCSRLQPPDKLWRSNIPSPAITRMNFSSEASPLAESRFHHPVSTSALFRHTSCSNTTKCILSVVQALLDIVGTVAYPDPIEDAKLLAVAAIQGISFGQLGLIPLLFLRFRVGYNSYISSTTGSLRSG